MAVVDFHVHMCAPAVLARCANNTVLHGFGARPAVAPEPGSRLAAQLAVMCDVDLQLADMDRRGVDVSVLSASTVVQNTSWAEPALQAELEARTNDELARWVERAPDRLVGSFTLPLRDVGLALAELERCTGELAMRVVNLPAAVDGDYLGAPRFRPLWEAIEQGGLVAFIHPDGVRDPWFQQYALWNSVGQPIEEAKVMASLILEGVLDAFGDVTPVMAHGGGFLPHYFGRLDRNVRQWPDSVRSIARLPSDYLPRFYYDTCVYDPSVLDALASRVGPDRLVLGSDQPVGEPDPVGFVRRANTVDDASTPQVLGETASRLLGIGSNERG
jgi:aminocarboxymuconate-semialdehyde decarboxylase